MKMEQWNNWKAVKKLLEIAFMWLIAFSFIYIVYLKLKLLINLNK